MNNKLLDDFKKIMSTQVNIEETFFEICGFPHREYVISNVLAFYLDSKNPHNLNQLLIESLTEVADIPLSNIDLQVDVEREVRTNNGGYIDILLSNDSLTIVIENKILSPLDNDLSDYYNYAMGKYPGAAYGIVLSIFEIDPGHPNFQNITYAKYFRTIKSKLGHFLGLKNNQYLFFLIDLINTIEQIEKGNYSMNSEFLTFIRENRDDVQKFGAELKAYHDNLRKIVKQVNAYVIESLDDPTVTQWLTRNLPEMHDIAVSDFELGNGVGVAIDSRADPDKWEFTVFVRKNPGEAFSIKDYCEEKGLEGELIDERFCLNETIPIEADPIKVSKKIVQIIMALKPISS